ncbi:MAG: response regulator transcription factor [Dysgonamonadaceae bacterium]|jgi:DNA-binding response OmpR family regulator|nr:response regulator transcription factor [Dysgonamonadaceae bacterium]
MNEKIKIFLCEDDENLGMLLSEYLQTKKFAVNLFPDGERGFKAFPGKKYDLCILDVMMPKKDGFALAQDIRKIDPEIPIIFLTAKNMKDDVLAGFKVGADDYLTKPFNMQELLLRIEAIMRRINGKKNKNAPFYQIGNYTFDTQKQTLTIGVNITKLTTKECDLLVYLCANMNEILDREFAVNTIWNPNPDFYQFAARSMDVYITKLRKLLKDDPRVEIINIHGKGYKLVVPVENGR